jgi:hypothetical protein
LIVDFMFVVSTLEVANGNFVTLCAIGYWLLG